MKSRPSVPAADHQSRTAAEPQTGPVTVPAHLARLLRTGPFPDALRAAISARGLSLDRIQDRLRRRGSTVSSATLSSWQSGRNRPERPSSLAALAVLEDVLRLPQGALAALLGPPRPRGRWLPTSAARPRLADVWPAWPDVTRALRGVDTRWDGSLTRLSCHTRLELDADGRERSKWSRQLLRADCDGPDRWVTVYRLGRPGPPPLVCGTGTCRTGAVVEAPESGLVVAELLFERPLARGETIIVEYTLEHRSPLPYSTNIESTLHVPVREYVLEVRFDPARLPASCHSYRTAELDSRPQERLLRPDSAGSVHAVALTAGPCRFGIRWAWE